MHLKLIFALFYSEYVWAIDHTRAAAEQNALFKLSVSAHEIFSNTEVRTRQD